MCKAGLATMGYFYFDFRDTRMQDARGFLTSLLVQLCAESDVFSDIMADMYSKHDGGSRRPSYDTLMQCLKKILEFPGQAPIYIIADALDECYSSSTTLSSHYRVLQPVKQLAQLHLPNLHLCFTSRPEADIRAALEPLASHLVSLHEEGGQKQDIIDYITTIVHSDPKMRRWRAEDKELVIRTLSEKAGGM
jgi:hypothetical protein